MLHVLLVGEADVFYGCAQVRMEELWRSTRQQEERRATTPGLLSKLRKNMGSGSSSGR